MVGSPPRILVAEDNCALLRVEQFALTQAGYRVTAVENGLLAWHAATADKYDLVLTDQQMPLLSGVELCRKLRARPEYATAPFIMLTAHGFELDLPRLKEELGIAEILAKPFSPSRLLKLVQEVLAPHATPEPVSSRTTSR